MATTAITSETEIANLALSRLGEPPISDIADNTVAPARAAERWYAVSRDAVLEESPWKFAETRAELTEDAAAPVTDWDNRFAVPKDLIALRSVNGYPPTIASTLYRLEDDFILTDEDAVCIIYTARVTNVAKFPASFVLALSHFLAMNFAREITQSTKDEEGQLQKYKIALGRARRNNAIQSPIPHRGTAGMIADSDLVRRRATSALG